MKTVAQKAEEAKAQLIDDKIVSVFQAINAEVKRVNIQSEAELASKIMLALIEFYESIGLPSLKIRKALAAPISKDWNETIKEFIEDIMTIQKEKTLMIESLQKSFAVMEQERSALAAQIRAIMRKSENEKNNANTDTRTVYTESFVAKNKLDETMCKKTPMSVNTTEGLATLFIKESTNLSNQYAVKVNNNSNGFPGNSHVITFSQDAVRFEGEDSLNFDCKAVLDGKLDTWFEYEMFKITKQVYESLDGLGFEFKEGVKWVSDDNKLALQIILEAKEGHELNWLSMSPFIPEHKGYSAAQLTEVYVDSGKGDIQHLLKTPMSFGFDVVLPFEKQHVKTIAITFSQPIGYGVDVGIHSYEESVESSSLFQRTEAVRMIKGTLPSVESIGVMYNPATGKYEQPSSELELNENDSSNDLFLTKANGIIKAAKVKRYVVGLKDISLSLNEDFEVESELISKPIETSKPISRISLEVDEIIPTSLDYSCLGYDISIDNGVSWLPINPINRPISGSIQYVINSNTISTLREQNIGYIDVDDEVYSVRFRVSAKRNIASNTVTPIVKEVKMIIEHGGVL